MSLEYGARSRSRLGRRFVGILLSYRSIHPNTTFIGRRWDPRGGQLRVHADMGTGPRSTG